MKMTIYHKNMLIAIFGLLPLLSFAQWTAVPIPVGTYIYRDLTVHKQSVYSTFFKNFQIKVARTNDNIHWELAASLPTNLNTVTPRCSSDGDRLYVTGKNNQANNFLAYVSNDDGANWMPLSWPNQTKTDLFEAWGNTLLAVNDSVILRSGDSGGSWQTVQQTMGKVYDLKRIGDQAWLITTETRLYRSTDDGLTWNSSTAPYDATGLTYAQLTIFPTEIGAFVKIYDTTSTIYRSTNLGASWANFSLPTTDQYYNVWDMLFLNGKLFITDGGISSSANEGITWERLETPNALVIEKRGATLCLGGSDGFFKSPDEGQNWWTGNLGWETVLGEVSTPFFSPDRIEYHQGKLYLFSYGEFYVTENEGIEWHFFRGKNFNSFRSFIAHGDSIFIVGGGAMRSFDNGNTWEYIPAGTNANDPLGGSLDFTSTNAHIFASAWFADSIYRSSDWGLNWELIAIPPDIFFLDYVVGVGNALYLSDGDNVYVSYSNGQLYSVANSGLGNNPYIQGLWGAENIPFALTGDQLFRRQNNLWKPATVGLYDDQGNLPSIVDITGDAGRVLLTGVKQLIADPLLYISDDNGQSWSGGWELGLPLIDYQFVATLHESTIYASGELGNISSGLGLWKRDVSVGSHEPLLAHPLACSLNPNPVSDATWLVFDKIPEMPCTVRVLDAMGRLQWQGTVSGESLQMQVANWPNGLYEVMVQNENGGFVRRPLVVQH